MRSVFLDPNLMSTLKKKYRVCVSFLATPLTPCFAPQCTGSCGEGVRERRVFCAEPHHCSTTQRPNSTEPCSLEPCAHWKSGDWEEVCPHHRRGLETLFLFSLSYTLNWAISISCSAQWAVVVASNGGRSSVWRGGNRLSCQTAAVRRF